MKILAKVTPRRMRQLHRVYYDTLDSIQEQMENWLDKVETKYDCEIHVDQSYNNFNGNDETINLVIGRGVKHELRDCRGIRKFEY